MDFQSIRLVVSDLDHTLLTTDGSITTHTLEAWEGCRQRGIAVGVATARCEQAAQRMISALRPDLVISNGGAAIRWKGELLHAATFSPESADRFARRCASSPHVGTLTAQGETHYLIHSGDHFVRMTGDYAMATPRDFLLPLGERVFKFSLQYFDREELAAIAGEFPEGELLYYTGENWCSFITKGISKHGALEEFSRRSGIALSQTAAFGDDFSDVGMLALCGCGVAMENAIPQAKEAAAFLTRSCDEDGVASFLEEHLLGNQG